MVNSLMGYHRWKRVLPPILLLLQTWLSLGVDFFVSSFGVKVWGSFVWTQSQTWNKTNGVLYLSHCDVLEDDNKLDRQETSPDNADHVKIKLSFWVFLKRVQSVLPQDNKSKSLACINMDLRNVSCQISTSGHHCERDESRQKPEPLDN